MRAIRQSELLIAAGEETPASETNCSLNLISGSCQQAGPKLEAATVSLYPQHLEGVIPREPARDLDPVHYASSCSIICSGQLKRCSRFVEDNPLPIKSHGSFWKRFRFIVKGTCVFSRCSRRIYSQEQAFSELILSIASSDHEKSRALGSQLGSHYLPSRCPTCPRF